MENTEFATLIAVIFFIASFFVIDKTIMGIFLLGAVIWTILAFVGTYTDSKLLKLEFHKWKLQTEILISIHKELKEIKILLKEKSAGGRKHGRR